MTAPHSSLLALRTRGAFLGAPYLVFHPLWWLLPDSPRRLRLAGTIVDRCNRCLSLTKMLLKQGQTSVRQRTLRSPRLSPPACVTPGQVARP